MHTEDIQPDGKIRKYALKIMLCLNEIYSFPKMFCDSIVLTQTHSKKKKKL